jgi:ribosome-associated heat shock protein Hsp15
MTAEPSDILRLDKWLWYARFFKSRTLATRLCASGRLRINGSIVKKAHYAVRPGDVLTFPRGPHIRVIRIVALGTRRGPATEARALYEDLQPPQAAEPEIPAISEKVAERERGSGRPTKVQRRATDKLRGIDED